MNAFTFFNDWETVWGEFHDTWTSYEILLSMSTENILRHSHAHLHAIYLCFCIVMAELSSCNRDHLAHKYLPCGPLQENLTLG